MNNIPNFDPLYDEVVAYVKEHQGEKGYIDCQPYNVKNPGDTIYTYEFSDFSSTFEERVVYGVRWNEETKDLEICFEPYMRTYRIIYDDDVFRGECKDPDADAKWYSVRWSDVHYIPTLLNIAENIEEYA